MNQIAALYLAATFVFSVAFFSDIRSSYVPGIIVFGIFTAITATAWLIQVKEIAELKKAGSNAKGSDTST